MFLGRFTGRFKEKLKGNLYWILPLVFLGWVWVADQYYHGSFVPIPEQGIIIPIETKFGVRYFSKWYVGISGAYLFGIALVVVFAIFKKISRRK